MFFLNNKLQNDEMVSEPKPEVPFRNRKFDFETGSTISKADLPFLERKLPILSVRAENDEKKSFFAQIFEDNVK